MGVVSVLLASSLVLLLIYRALTTRHSKRFLELVNKIPGPPTQLIVGNGWQYLKTSSAHMLHILVPEMFKTFGPVVRFWIINECKIIISRAEDVMKVLQGRTHIHKSGSYNYLQEFIGNTVIPASGQKWQNDRKFLNPIFSRSNLSNSMPIVLKHVPTLIDILKKKTGKDFVIHDEIHDCVSDFVFESFFGYEKNAMISGDKDLWNASMSSNIIVAQRVITPLTLDWVYAFSYLKKQMAKNREVLNHHADKVIAFWKSRLLKMGDEIEKSTLVGDQLMLMLKDMILAYNAGNSEIEDELRIQVKNIIFAAVETTSVVTSSILFMLGTHPELQEKVYEEMIEVLGDEEPDLSKLSELHYLELFMKETLRLYPVAPFIERHLIEEATLENYVLPAGCNVTVAIYHLHRDPAVWHDPETFDPNRFLPENCKDRHPYAYIPFSAGARNCIGQAYAMMTMKTMLCAIVRNFKIEAARTRSQLKTKFRLLLYPDNGHPVRIYERNPTCTNV